MSMIGKGGMGDVYCACDTKPNRDVALRVLGSKFANDHERMARFKSEAQLLASLNHPNVAAIHELEKSDGIQRIPQSGRQIRVRRKTCSKDGKQIARIIKGPDAGNKPFERLDVCERQKLHTG